MSEKTPKPIIDKIELLSEEDKVQKRVNDIVEDVYDKRGEINDGEFKPYDARSFHTKLQIDPFRVDGFARITFTPTLLSVTIVDDKIFNLVANQMPSFYQHKSSLWQISLSPTFENIVKEESDISGDLTTFSFIFEELPYSTVYYFRVKYFTNVSYTGWSNILSVTTRPLLPIDKPVLSGEVIDLRNINLTSSAYHHNELPHTKTRWEISPTSSFTSTIFSKETDNVEEMIHISPVLLSDLIVGQFYSARVKYFNKYAESEWSDPIALSLSALGQPTILNVTLKTSNSFELTGSIFSHPKLDQTHSEWVISSKNDFSNPVIVKKSETELTIGTLTLNENIVLDDDITYYFRLRHWSDSAFSQWSNTFILNITNITKPTITNLMVTTNNTIHVEASEFVHSLLTHKKSTWQISHTNNFETILKEVNSSSELRVLNTLLETNLQTKYAYYVRVRYHSDMVESDWSDPQLLNIVIPKPIIGTINLNNAFNFVVDSSDFTHSYLTHTSSIWEMSYLNNFSDGLYTNTSSTLLTDNEINLVSQIRPNTNYFVRVKYACGYLESDWSDTFTYKTDSLTKPTITGYSYNNEIKQFNLSSSVFSYKDRVHTRSDWEISKFSDFSSVIETRTIVSPSNMNVVTFDIPEDTGDTWYYFRIKQFSDTYESVWSDTLSVKTPSMGAIDTPTIDQPGLLCPFNFYLESSPFEKTGDITQTKTIWQICENNLFAVGDPTLKEFIVDDSSDQSFTSLLIEESLIEEGKTYYVRVKYLSEP